MWAYCDDVSYLLYDSLGAPEQPVFTGELG